MKKMILGIILLLPVITYSEETSNNKSVKMDATIDAKKEGQLIISVTGHLDFGNLNSYNGQPVGISEDVEIRDTSLLLGETSTVKVILDNSAELSNGTTTLTVIPEFRYPDTGKKNEKTITIVGDIEGNNKVFFPVYSRIIGTREVKTVGIYTGSFNIRTEYVK